MNIENPLDQEDATQDVPNELKVIRLNTRRGGYREVVDVICAVDDSMVMYRPTLFISERYLKQGYLFVEPTHAYVCGQCEMRYWLPDVINEIHRRLISAEVTLKLIDRRTAKSKLDRLRSMDNPTSYPSLIQLDPPFSYQ